MTSESIRDKILNSLIELKNKKDNTIIPILSKSLVFEASKYSSTKENIWHVFINDNKIKKTSEYLFSYKCLTCNKLNTCASTQFLRKIRQAKPQCFQCNNINLNQRRIKSDPPHLAEDLTSSGSITDYNPRPKTKVEKLENTYHEKYNNSKKEFELYPDQYKNSYLLSHLSIDDYNRIKPNIISFGNGKFTDIDNYEYWPIFKINNQMKFSYVIYDNINDMIFKADQPVMKCDNCEKSWRCKKLETFKTCLKILCADCKLCNRTFKIRPIKNINNDIIMYQSKLELKFIEWCASKNVIIKNGPNIEYIFNKKSRKYRVDFQINNILIEMKDFHIWHKNQVESGMWDEKLKAANKYIIENNLKKYYFITPNNWNQKIKELENDVINNYTSEELNKI
jgi:hypothetical protein